MLGFGYLDRPRAQGSVSAIPITSHAGGDVFGFEADHPATNDSAIVSGVGLVEHDPVRVRVRVTARVWVRARVKVRVRVSVAFEADHPATSVISGSGVGLVEQDPMKVRVR